MIDTKGKTYRIWLSAFPWLKRLARRGEFGLALPGKDSSDLRADWWRDNLYKNTRRVISEGFGGVPTILLGVISILATLLVPVIPEVWITFPRWLTW